MEAPDEPATTAPMMPPVLRSKITRPSSLTDVVQRAELASSVAEAAARVAVISAPAGFGKTTLLDEVASLQPGRVAWVNIDAGDNDRARFWVHIAAALDDVGVATEAVLAAVSAGGVAAVDALTVAIEQSAGETTLVLDDAHELIDAGVINDCSLLVTNPPAALRIAVSTRTDLEWPIARLRTRGEVVEVGVTDLALTDDAGAAVLSAELADGLIDRAGVDEIVRRVEGWPAGLRLAKLALRGGQDAADLASLIGGDQPKVAEYLAGEVLDRRPDEEREFLLATSILTDLTPAACDAVTAQGGSLSMLRRLHASQVFTTLTDVTTSTYAYHRLLREFLQSKLDERSATEIDELHDRAATHFELLGDTGAVVRHSVATGNTERALDALEAGIVAAASDGRIAELWSWIGVIGPEHVLAHPGVSAMPMWASLNFGRFDEIEPWFESFALLDDTSNAHRRDFALHAAAVRCHRDRHLGALDRAVGHALDVLDLLTDQPRALVTSSALVAAGASFALAGDERAEHVLRQSIQAAQHSGELSSVVMAYCYLALVADDPDDALAHADSALGLVKTPEQERFHVPILAWFVRGRLSLAAGRVGDAEAELAIARRLAIAGRDPLVESLVAMQQARLQHLLGADAERRAALRRADSILDGAHGVDWLRAEAKAAHAATRFVALEDEHLAPEARTLSERELTVLHLLPHGLSRKELAAQLFLSENTVKTHLTSIRHKLGVRGSADLLERARELGVLPGIDSGE